MYAGEKAHADRQETCELLERAAGIEPTSETWKVRAYLTKTLERRHFSPLGQSLKRKTAEYGKGRRNWPETSVPFEGVFGRAA
jgi:hypothetical protein